MSVVEVKIQIGAPIERVWETIMDPARLGDWVTIHRSVSGAPSPPLREGATMDQSLALRGVSFNVHWTLAHVDPPHVAQWDGRGPAHSRARIRYELRAGDTDTTVFEYTNEFAAPGGMLGVVASRVIVGAASEREAHNSLQRLKALLERN